MPNVIDFPDLAKPADMELLRDVINSEKFQNCHDKFFANHNVSEMPFKKVLMAFYLYGYLEAAYDSL